MIPWKAAQETAETAGTLDAADTLPKGYMRIHVGESRKQTHWRQCVMSFAELAGRFDAPVVDDVTRAEYMKLSKKEQDERKDVGGYVGGSLRDGARNCVTSRVLVTLDLDALPSDGIPLVLERLNELGCAYAVHPTRKHTEERPRLRAVLPLAREVAPDEYGPIARKIAEKVGLEWCDAAGFRPAQLMYWPSVCRDTQYKTWSLVESEWLRPDDILALYADWMNPASWPRTPLEMKTEGDEARRRKLDDPGKKKGMVGAFCRVYDIPGAIAEFLGDVYEPLDSGLGALAEGARYTYAGGSAAGGAVVYDSKWLYSFHATDPAGGRSCNAFDLVRLHKFAVMDDADSIHTPIDKRKSYQAMCELAGAIPEVRRELVLGEAVMNGGAPMDKEAFKWMENLEVNEKTGKIAKTGNNILAIINNDPRLKGKLALEVRLDRYAIMSAVPWDDKDKEYPRGFTDGDEIMIRCIVMEPPYSVDAPHAMIADAIGKVMNDNRFNEVYDYFVRLQHEWDGVDRVDTLLTRCFDVEDSEYTRAVIRKTLCAAVARNLSGGSVKFDTGLVLVGEQGIGKSTFLKKLLPTKWVADNVPRDLSGKDALLALRGAVLVELAELDQYNKNESGTFKHFMSREYDTYRAPYGRHTNQYIRRCVFIATANQDEFLRDSTGERRYWPVTCRLPRNGIRQEALQWIEDNRDQLWAEAAVRWRRGEHLFLEPHLIPVAETAQVERTIRNDMTGVVEDWLNIPLPDGWDDYDLTERLDWYEADGMKAPGVHMRKNTCVLEVWRECFKERRRPERRDSLEVATILKQIGWKPTKAGRWPIYGVQKVYLRE